MANTTFSGAVRSESGFKQVTKNGSTGAFTTNFDVNSSGNITDVGSITSDGAISTTGIISTTVGMANATGVVGSRITSKTQLANGTTPFTLIKNTHYLSAANGDANVILLPAIASSSAGDVIIVEYQVGINTGETQKFGTAGEFFMAGSAVYRMTGATGSATGLIMSVDTADGAADDFLNMIGLANSGPGIGSSIVFSFNGTGWRAEARCTSSGTGIAANLSVFAAT